MRKLISSIVLVAMVVCGKLAADQDELLKFIPQQTRTMMYVNVEEFLNSEIVREARATNLDIETAFGEAEKVSADAGFVLSDFVQDLIVCSDNRSPIGGLATTRVPADKVPELLKKLAESKNQPTPTIEVAKLDGRTVIKTEEFTVVYITDRVVLFLAPNSNILTVVSGLGKILPRNRELVSFARKDLRGNLMWLVNKSPSARELKEDSALANNFNQSVEFVYAKVVQSGEKKDTLILSGQAYCYEISSAHKAVKDATAVVGLFTGMIFSDDSELAAKVMNAFSFTSKGKEFNFSLSVPPTLVDEIGTYIEYKAQAQAGGYDVNGGLETQLLMESITAAMKEMSPNQNMSSGSLDIPVVEFIEIEKQTGGAMNVTKTVLITMDKDKQPVSYQMTEIVLDNRGNHINTSVKDLTADSPEAQKALTIYNEKKASEESSSSSN